MGDSKQPYRLRPIRRKMSFETFERTVPWRPGWKREYYGGRAHVRPSWSTVTFVLELSEREPVSVPAVRDVTPADRPELLSAFLDAFRYAPEYCGYPMAAYRKRAREYFDGFFGDARGQPSPTSTLIINDGRVVAAALVKEDVGRQPLLDCLFVRPDVFRRGLGTAAAAVAVNRLIAAGYRELKSFAMLANVESLAWHEKFGFRERPDLWVAQARCFSTRHELERREKLGDLTDDERTRMTAYADHWGAECERLHDMPFPERYADIREGEPQ
ncbi:MAG: GNAT family N-acetyltransferase [Fimbriiglobus sp.]